MQILVKYPIIPNSAKIFNLYHKWVFVRGAGGGPGVENRGRSLGASLRATFDWEEGDEIYILLDRKALMLVEP
ncbi:hypothetical protein CEXT_4631 [Caerostris extrusa]|uniref:Uncharacterized protein n=1 Tax=Caerostris extrusa TaxID=172846 RepID=A0AAV4TBB0_CAEEX|nr:hypothetical protein CEXT_4631 [Caerostris extrusa]